MVKMGGVEVCNCMWLGDEVSMDDVGVGRGELKNVDSGLINVTKHPLQFCRAWLVENRHGIDGTQTYVNPVRLLFM